MKSKIHEGDGLKSDENDARNAYDIIFAEPKLNGDEIFKNLIGLVTCTRLTMRW
jgi:hypothetical protein